MNCESSECRAAVPLQKAVTALSWAIDWLRPDGAPLTEADWNDATIRAIAVRYRRDEPQAPVNQDYELLLLLNTWWWSVIFRLPAPELSKATVMIHAATTEAEASSRLILGPSWERFVETRSFIPLRKESR